MGYKKRLAFALLLCLTLLSGLLSGCAEARMEAVYPAANAFIEAWQAGDYAGMYGQLGAAARERITSGDFLARYESLFTDLEMTVTVQAGEPSLSGSKCFLPMTARYSQADLGEFEVALRMPLVKEGGQWHVDWSPSLIFPQMGWGDFARFVRLSPARGEIFAVGGEVLARNGYLPTLYVEPELTQDLEATALALAPITGMEAEAILKLCQSPGAALSGVAVIKAFAPGDAQELAQRIADLPGVGIDTRMYTPNRQYPYGSLLAHVLGYAQPTTAELKEASDHDINGPFVGIAGLEAKYDPVMQGTMGAELSVMDSQGNRVAVVARVEPVNGADLHLTIDLELQQRAETLLKAAMGTDSAGVAVVLDPHTGAVEAIASYPTYDLNMFVHGLTTEQWDALNDEAANKPLFNRALLGLYPPGSTFKPFTAIMGIEAGVINGSFVFTQPIVNDAWVPQGIKWYWPSIKRYRGYEGPVNLYNSMVHSDNIYFAYAALETGEEGVRDFAARLKLDQSVPFDLTAAAGQLLSKPEEPFESLRILADTGYGQGEVLMTPLQLAASFSIFANGGDAYAPYIVQAYYETVDGEYMPTQTFAPELWLEDIMTRDQANVLLPALRGVVTEGTGTGVRIEGMSLAGKSGTAELNYDKSRSIAWFTGFSEGEAHDRLVCIMEEAPAGGNYQRIPIARELLRPREQQEAAP